MAFSTCFALLCFPFTLDDAYITFHYARNLAAGHGFGIWNIGEPPVEGCSSLLWTVILGLGMRLHVSPFYLSKLLGFICAIAMPLSAYQAYRSIAEENGSDSEQARSYACAALLLSCYVPLFFYSVTGMETTFFALQVLLLLLLPTLKLEKGRMAAVIFLSMSMVLTRPEGVFLGVLVFGCELLRARNGRYRRYAAAGMLAVLGTFAAITLFRFDHFNALLPNTYYAKATGGSLFRRLLLGVFYVIRFLELVLPITVVFCFLLVHGRKTIRSSTSQTSLLFIVVAYTVYVMKVGGDPDSAFPFRRHFVHIIGILALLMGSLIAKYFRSLSAAVGFTATLAGVTVLWMVVGWARTEMWSGFRLEKKIGLLRLAPVRPIWSWFQRYSSSQTLTALSGAGEWPYVVPGRYIDMLGLNDAHIARYGMVDPSSAFQDSKSDMHYVISRRPDILDGYFPATELLQNKCPIELHGNRGLMLREMVKDQNFINEYRFVVNGPYKLMDHAIFFRADYVTKLHDPELVTVPVLQTSLYRQPCS